MTPRTDRKVVLLAADDANSDSAVRIESPAKALGFSLEIMSDTDAVVSCLQGSDEEIAAVFLEASASDPGCTKIVRKLRTASKDLPLIVIADQPSVGDIVEVMRSGATDFLAAPLEFDGLMTALSQAVESSRLLSGPAVKSEDGTGFLASQNLRMREIQSQIGPVGWSGVPVLIQGETGSGKEVLARELHARSARACKPFLKLNCAALPSELVESELFGYERGAFTGAFQRKAGMFEMADGGTLFLDEIGDMDVRLQAKLLQVLQDHEFRRIGGKELVRVDVRIIAATHKDLEKSILENTFRSDLYYRLNVVNFVVPPLRDRREDIVAIAEFLLRKHAPRGSSVPSVNSELRQAMIGYHWPGNVRELENYMRKVMIFRDCSLVARDIQARTIRKHPEAVRSIDSPDSAFERNRGLSVLEQATRVKERAETEAILNALDLTHWNRKQAAVILNIDYKSLLYKMKKLGIDNTAIPGDERTTTPIRAARAAASGGD